MARRSPFFCLWAALTLLNHVLGTPISLSDKRSAPPGMIGMPISRKSRSLSKRNGILADLSNQESYYSINVGVGSPPQSISLDLDTGSSDTWVFTPSACSSISCIGGSFDPSQSTSFADIEPGAFSIEYHDGSQVLGDFITDNMEISDVTISSLEMGLANSASGFANKGFMGVGFDTNEAEAATSVYPNIIDDMVSQGLIGGRFYSLWLDDLAANTGTILFGGYDSSKYSGDLATLSIVPDSDGVYRSFGVEWTSLSITDESGTTTYTTAGFEEVAILDSGTTVTRIDPAIFNILYQYFNAATNTDSNGNAYYTVDCSIGSVEGSIDYGFPGVTISVPFSELAIPDSGESYCLFGFIPDTLNLFGDTFLRSAYVVYDLDQKEVGLAQTIFQ